MVTCKQVCLLIALIVMISLSHTKSSATLIINEVMVNEPGGNTSAEWIEIFNTDTSNFVNLAFVQITFGGNNLTLQGSLKGRKYAIIARDTALFNSIWSQTIPDSIVLIEHSFSLVNAADSMKLFLVGNLESKLSWSSAGNDGISWERVNESDSIGVQSVDPSGSTPGRINSASKVPNDLGISIATIVRIDQTSRIVYAIDNLGLQSISNSYFKIFILNAMDSSITGQAIDSLLVPTLDSGDFDIVQTDFNANSYYSLLLAVLPADDRTSNDSIIFYAPGSLSPAIVLNEFLANPTGLLSSEWIELYNQSDTTIDLLNWQIGDSLGLSNIVSTSQLMTSGEYLILAEDRTNFLNFYDSIIVPVIELTTWRKLNNSGDKIRLVDHLSILIDQRSYNNVFDSNSTWSRGVSAQMEVQWGMSDQAGGSPGGENSLSLSPTSKRSSLTVTPKIFSPNNDGIDDEILITLEAPVADSYSLKIYDKNGREVRVFEDKSSVLSFPPEYDWDGRSNSGRLLPIGIYIIYFEADGVESLKETVVIAR